MPDPSVPLGPRDPEVPRVDGAADSVAAKKDHLILAMLAVMGGQDREVNERDLFMACWHGFPNAMRWVDTALPNPDTFTAALRRLDAAGAIRRVGKQVREQRRRKKGSPRALEVGRSGVVKARITEGGLDRAGISPALLEHVRRLAPNPQAYESSDDVALVLACIELRQSENRAIDEGAIVETAFHKFPARFAYEHRPEFPDVERIRRALNEARQRGLVGTNLVPTREGRQAIEHLKTREQLSLDASGSHSAGLLKFADRIEKSAGYAAYRDSGTLVATKPDEVFRILRVPPTTDPRPVASVLVTKTRDLRRIDKGDLAEYLLAVARKHNPSVADIVSATAISPEITLGDSNG